MTGRLYKGWSGHIVDHKYKWKDKEKQIHSDRDKARLQGDV